MNEHKSTYPITMMARLLKVSVSRFYDWLILKNELVHHRHYKTREEAKSDITKYIELFYNQSRIQKSLNFKTPNQMAEDFYKLAA